jgi:MGT family glycosyltransferase
VARLVHRGHAVAVLGDPSLEEDVKRTGAAFAPWREAPHKTTRQSDILGDWAARTPFGAFARARDRHAFGPANLFAREVRQRFEAHPADVVVADALLFGALVGAEATGARVAALLPMTSFLPAPRRPPPSIGLSPARGVLGRIRDRALLAAGDALLWRTCTPLLNRARAEMGLAPVAHPLEQLRRADRVLVQTSAWFDFGAHPHDNVRWVGPELGDPVWASSHVQSADVLVAFSTTYMGQTSVLQKILDALAPLSLRAIVTTGPALGSNDLRAPANVTLCASAPHSELMPRASLVVTHGGHGTVIRALAYGVPLLCMPMGRDQSDNAVRVRAIGAGITVSPRSSVAKIRRAILRGVRDRDLHRGARHARDVIARERSGDPVVDELEGLL